MLLSLSSVLQHVRWEPALIEESSVLVQLPALRQPNSDYSESSANGHPEGQTTQPASHSSFPSAVRCSWPWLSNHDDRCISLPRADWVLAPCRIGSRDARAWWRLWKMGEVSGDPRNWEPMSVENGFRNSLWWLKMPMLPMDHRW